MKDPTGKSAPSGGFKTGGWYSGYQYWDGSFAPTAGQIHPSSNQQGAGSLVSKEVIAQTDSKNVNYIQNLRANPPTPTSKDQVNPYLAGVQDTTFNSANTPETKVPTLEALKAELTPTTGVPETINRVAELNKLRTEYGVSELETQLADLKTEQAALLTTDDQRKAAEEGKPIPLGVIGGRQTEIQRQDQIKLDSINRSIGVVTDQLNMKYNTIGQIINYMGLDYQDAKTSYDSQFQTNLTLYGIIRDIKKENWTEAQAAQATAQSNLQIYANAITNGNMSYANLPADQKLMIQKLELQSGLPSGTIANLQMSPKDKIAAFSDDKTQAMIIDGNGNMKVVQTGFTKSASSQTETQKKQTAVADMSKTLNEMGGSDYLVSPEQWKQARSVWISAGFSGSDFDSNFSTQYVDYSHPENYGIYQ